MIRIAWDVVAAWMFAVAFSLCVDYALLCGVRRLVAYVY
jgi:hypothetical protein